MGDLEDFELEIKKAGKTLGELIEKHESTIGLKIGIRIALEAILKEIFLGRQRKAELFSIEVNKILEEEKKRLAKP